MFDIDENYNISLTRGDTGIFQINLVDTDGSPYTPVEGDKLRFAMAKQFGGEVLSLIDIPIQTCILKINPSDTKELDFGNYVYDIQFTDHEENVSTIIVGKMNLTKEVE